MSFSPSERQIKFRELASRLYDNGVVFKREWCLASREIESLKENPITLFESQEWDKEPGYSDWFYSVFPVRIGPDEAEYALMDWQFWRGISAGMQDGKEWAFKTYKSARWGNEDANRKSSSNAELKDFLGVSSKGAPSPWKLSKIAEA
jgi:hypothetical protein